MGVQKDHIRKGKWNSYGYTWRGDWIRVSKKGEERKRKITDWIRKGTAKIKEHMKATMET